MVNQSIYRLMCENNVYSWQVAYALGYTDREFCELIDQELSEEQVKKIMKVIGDIKGKRYGR